MTWEWPELQGIGVEEHLISNTMPPLIFLGLRNELQICLQETVAIQPANKFVNIWAQTNIFSYVPLFAEKKLSFFNCEL